MHVRSAPPRAALLTLLAHLCMAGRSPFGAAGARAVPAASPPRRRGQRALGAAPTPSGVCAPDAAGPGRPSAAGDRAALLMVFGAICVAVQNGVIRVASAEIHTFEVVFFRNLFGLVAMLPLLGGVGLGMFRAHTPAGCC